jgi:alkaline phosphatase D
VGAPTRREFLLGAAAVLAAAGCSDDDGGDGDASPPAGEQPGTSATPTTTAAQRLAADPFTLGIASGDPLADSVILWTRLAPDPLAPDGLGGMPADAYDVAWEVATDERFTSIVRRGVATAEPQHAHAVHVDVDGLDPATDYRYRFRVGDFTSPVGRTRTLPGGSPRRFALAVANCQWLETGSYAAYRHLLDEDIDLVLHLGDYIYEFAGVAGSPRMAQPAHLVTSLTDYRLRYASYKLDPALVAAHARFPFSLTWDDHEVANNYMGDVLEDDPSPEAGRARKEAAYQAWWEHLPVRVDPPDGADLVVHRDFAVGDLARVYLLDERQDAAVPPCRGEVADDLGDCAARTAGGRTRLGADQEAWFAEATGRGGVTWNVVGNPVVLAGLDAGPAEGPSAYYLDTWDGYPEARLRLVERLAAIDNPVVLTGDYHAGMVLDVHERPFDTATPVVATELMAPPISSVLFPSDLTARTPHLRHHFDAHGYLTVEIEPDRLTARFRVLDDVSRDDSPIRTESTWRLDAGSPAAQRI